jgi:integrase
MFKLAKLTTDHVKKCIDGINRSVSAKTASRILYVVRAALRYAQDNMGLGQNVAMSVKSSWINRRNEPKVGITMPVPSPQEAVRLIDGAGATLPQIKALVMTALFTGLRWKELRLLTWDDIIFDENVIVVRKAKTAAGVRRYPISPELKDVLLEWRLVCPRAGNPGGLHTSIQKAKEIERLIRAGKTQREICQEVGVTHYAVVAVRAMMRGTPASVHSSKAPTVERRIRAAANYNEVVPPGQLNYVFPTQGGTMRSYASGIERMRTLQRKLGMLGEDGRPKYVPHRTRHFLASWGIKQRWPLKELSVMLGHSSIRETLDTYGHLFADPEADQERMARSDAAFRALGLGGTGQPAEVVNLKDAARNRSKPTPEALANVAVTKTG